MNILYIDPLIDKSNIYTYYSGLYNELKKLTPCFLHRGEFCNLIDIIKRSSFNPDIIFFGMGWHEHKFWSKIDGIENLNIPVVCQLFKPQIYLEEKLGFCKRNNVSLIITSIPSYLDYQKATGIPTKRLCYAAETNIFKDRGLRKIYDFGFTGAFHNANRYSPGSFKSENLRSRIINLVKSEKNISYFIKASDITLEEQRIFDQQEYAAKINQSKIWLATDAACGDITPRYFEICMSKTLLLCSEIPEAYKDIFRDRINCVSFKNDLSDFLEKLHFYLKNDDDRNKITEYAYTDFHTNHTWNKRAKEFLSILSDCKKKHNEART